jgi:4-hydroxybenzoate polyprenyltransferase
MTMLDFIRRNPARVYAVVLAIVVLLSAYGIDLPRDAWLGLVAALLALAGGEAVQRVEDRKTQAAAGAADQVP